MADFIESIVIAGGDGGNANVVDNCLKVRPQSRFQAATAKGDAFCWACVTQNYDAGDTMMGLQNDETTRNLYIEKIVISSTTTSEIKVFGTSGVTVAGDTAITGVCLNRNYNRVPQTSCYDDETGQDQAGASWPTSYAGAFVLAGQPVVLDFGGSIVLAPNQYIGVDAVADIAGGNVTIWGWFE